MPRFFTHEISGGSAAITGEDARHIARSLRCRVGEKLTLCDGMGRDYLCSITALDDSRVLLDVLESAPTAAEPPLAVTLYQAMPKGDKPELITQKAVELGAGRIVFITTRRCVARPEPGALAKRLERLQRIAAQAAKQSGRGIVPSVEGGMTLTQALDELTAAGTPGVLFYENATAPLGRALGGNPGSLGVIIGAEGGFDPQEAEQCAAAGLACCTMGPRILRCETAALYALAAVMYRYENS